MDKRAIFLGFALFAAAAAAEEAYTWVDDEGIVHYSDIPEEGAERVILPEANTTSVRRYRQSPAEPSAASPSAAAAPVRYESFTVAAPAAEETQWNIEGVLSVSLALTPALMPGHQVRVYFDNREPQLGVGMRFTIQEVYRGEHTIQAEVIDDTGKLMIRSEHNRFYVQQNRVR